MDENKNIELTKEQLDEVAGGAWDEENNFHYFEGTVEEVGNKVAIVNVDGIGRYECTCSREFITQYPLRVNIRVCVRWPERIIFKMA